MKLRIFSFITGVFVAGSAAAAPLNLVCDMTIKGTKGTGAFISSPLVLLVNDAQNGANVIDGLILAVNDKAVPGRVQKTSKGLRIKWRVDQIPVFGGRYTSVSYTGTLDPKSNRVKVRGRILNAENNIRGAGVCRELTQAEVRNGKFLRP